MDDIVEKINKRADAENPEGILVKYVHNHLILDFPTNTKKLYSPQMDINLEFDKEKNQVLVRCLIGPSSSVWTLFMFFYGLLGFVALIGLMIGSSQWSMDKFAWGFWLFFGALILGGVLHMASLYAQRLSYDEMTKMKLFLDRALDCDCFQVSEAQRLEEEGSAA